VTGVAATLAALAVLLLGGGGVRALDWELYDRWIRPRAPVSVSPALVVVVRDAASEARLGRGAWDRAVLARLVTGLSRAGAAAIGLDVALGQPSAPGRGGAASDALLSQATALAGAVVYPLALELDGPQSMTFRSSGDLRADILLIDALLGRANRSTSRRIPFLAPGCLLLVAAFAACATPRILLRHPSTGVTVECGAEGELPGSGAAYRRQRDCVEDYQRQGYERGPR